MGRDPGSHSEEIVREFYASYASTLGGSIHRNANPRAHNPFTSILVQGIVVDISRLIIVRFLYGPSTSRALNTTEFDYQWDIVRGRLSIKKATLTFVVMFFWLLVRNWISGTKVNNALTWDRVVMVATLVAGFEIEFARMFIEEIHKRAFKASTTYPFPCLIFQLCRNTGMPIWHCDKLTRDTGTFDIGLIQDEANVVAPRRELQVDVPPLGADLVDDVEQM
uniref:Integrase core domain containing protein n=1 Tax=Solanum tuberosum TaxID=4113 RepID=M1D833_SOLTU